MQTWMWVHASKKTTQSRHYLIKEAEVLLDPKLWSNKSTVRYVEIASSCWSHLAAHSGVIKQENLFQTGAPMLFSWAVIVKISCQNRCILCLFTVIFDLGGFWGLWSRRMRSVAPFHVFFSVDFLHVKTLFTLLSCQSEWCSAVLFWSSRNVWQLSISLGGECTDWLFIFGQTLPFHILYANRWLA